LNVLSLAIPVYLVQKASNVRMADRVCTLLAATLGISAKTVEGHLSSASAKLGLRSRAQLAVYVARSCG
jgi:FixJ family two-component response regulator